MPSYGETWLSLCYFEYSNSIRIVTSGRESPWIERKTHLQFQNQYSEPIAFTDKSNNNFTELARIQQPHESSRTKAGVRHFILISTIMTWAATKPRTSKPFTEADFKKRKASTNFKEHIDCERNVARRRSNLLRGLVLSIGMTYGEKEADLHYAFKLAWSNEQSLPVVGDGGNLVPLLHVSDLAS